MARLRKEEREERKRDVREQLYSSGSRMHGDATFALVNYSPHCLELKIRLARHKGCFLFVVASRSLSLACPRPFILLPKLSDNDSEWGR